MKKMIIVAAMFVTLGAFAKETTVSPKVLNAFQTEFSTAQQVQWTVSTDFYKASFDMNGQTVSAFYNTNGDFIGLTRNISTSQLPITLQASLKRNHSADWISDLFEVSNADGTSYFVTLEDGTNKTVLKSSNGSDWSRYKKDRKI